MHTTRKLGTLAALAIATSGAAAMQNTHADTTLTRAQKAAGWTVLFDGSSLEHFRGYKKDTMPDKGWVIKDGVWHVPEKSGGGDIVTKEQYTDFELVLDFKCAPGGNSGVMYRVDERHQYPWMTGPEFQLLDDAGWKEPADGVHATGALYDIVGPAKDKPYNPAGEWNTARIRLKDGLLTHALNGRIVLEQRLDTPEWRSKIAASKFKGYEGFGVQPKGYLALQDHGQEVWFRDIKVRDLSKEPAGATPLFDGKSLAGWVPVLKEQAAPEEIWTIKDGVLICSGSPAGYLRTKDSYTNYVLRFDWRWSPETKKAGNSGVLLRIDGEDKVWPKCIEAQLQSGSAGDFWALGDASMESEPARRNGRNTKGMHKAERPIGEWNTYEIHVDGGDITLFVNGDMVNKATGCEAVAGPIGFQSEGTEIHFRNINIIPLD